MLASRLSVLLVFAATGLVAFAQDDAAKEEVKKLQGTWKIVSVEIDGKKQPVDQAKMVFIFKDNTMQFLVNDQKAVEGTFTVKPSAKPKEIDVTHNIGPNKGKVDMNLYELDGDTLKIAGYTGDISLTKRPTAFPKEGAKGFDSFVLKREK
jgi:uncharacterized protein (TIGR03067 family)